MMMSCFYTSDKSDARPNMYHSHDKLLLARRAGDKSLHANEPQRNLTSPATESAECDSASDPQEDLLYGDEVCLVADESLSEDSEEVVKQLLPDKKEWEKDTLPGSFFAMVHRYFALLELLGAEDEGSIEYVYSLQSIYTTKYAHRRFKTRYARSSLRTIPAFVAYIADHLRYEPSVAVGMSSQKTQRPLEGTFTVWDRARTVKDAHATVQTTLGMQEDP
ncbi:uncharacterized protein PITG_22238 [Phytophthora infestans T30-4]|uniref:Uncharacterized protein n=1 Tax=Phytophthora infestans (strain T30-4) TaxID=403677 RepID=D0RM09_PHYIT|nr:uncharacterized protein PITG_22238 [Phytophthora infestans T30-4]EEY57051.1 conserved hypothetical protein [Phytophthora infestans T30-4]|eukprot:XP_002909921.1 conserved hypothetical protein [Phytophthora infestans T30-4]